MSQAIIDLKETLILIKNLSIGKNRMTYSSTPFQKISQVYPFTNEFLKQYNDCLDLKDKKVLTVTASADQVIEAIIKGAKEIDTFDCNKLTYYHLFFKLAALQTLSYSDFNNLYSFGEKESQIKTKKDYYKILRDAIRKEDVLEFWDGFFKYSDYYFTLFFIGFGGLPEVKKATIGYLDEGNYIHAQENIHDNVGFSNIDVNLIPYEYYDKKFDFINLSNIVDYQKKTETFFKMLRLMLDQNLTDNGEILASYNWQEIDEDNEIYNKLLQESCNPSLQHYSVKLKPLKYLKLKDEFMVEKEKLKRLIQ